MQLKQTNYRSSNLGAGHRNSKGEKHNYQWNKKWGKCKKKKKKTEYELENNETANQFKRTRLETSIKDQHRKKKTTTIISKHNLFLRKNNQSSQ